MPEQHLTRRRALGALGAIAAGSVAGAVPVGDQASPAAVPATSSPAIPGLAPRVDLVNVLEFEPQAKLTLGAAAHAAIAGGDRTAFDRITLRPRMMVPTTGLDMSLTLLGLELFAPIIVGPVAGQRRFHPTAELGTVQGAAAAKALVIVSAQSSVPIAELVAVTKSPLWYQVFASEPAARAQASRAVAAGCRAICATVGAAPATVSSRAVASAAPLNWAAVAALKRSLSVPLLVKGITTPEAARQALQQDVQALVVSNYGGLAGGSKDALILTLPRILEAADGRVPVLVDGSFRRGTDVIKALALGAKAVLVSRPVMWGLAAYGADGVQGVLEMLQTELGRYMAMCGKPTLAALDPNLVRVHAARLAGGPGRV